MRKKKLNGGHADTFSIHVRSAGRAILDSGYNHPLFVSADHDLHYTTKGRGTIFINGTGYPVTAGDIVIVRPGESFRVTADDGLLERFYIHFDSTSSSGPEPLLARRFMVADLNETHMLCTRIVKEKLAGDIHARAMCGALLTELLVPLLRNSRKSTDGGISPQVRKNLERLQQVREHLKQHCTAQVSRRELEDIAQLSINHLERLFKAFSGYTPHQYQLKCRIDRARELFIAGGRTITEIAAMTGYSGLHKFSDSFRKWTGMRPSEYIKRVNPEIIDRN
ncbi:MAG: helix-turn-helix transcriptional regulator [Spirochaetes bacterium]|nr:helix-turn-helix transcriptional regulator [Spirochaetota bacterium]